MPSLVGNKPNQVPSNGDLGTLAFQDSNAVNITGGIATVDRLTVDGTTLVVDSTNDRVGIGTSSPAAKLHVVGNETLLDDGTNGRITFGASDASVNRISSTTTGFGAYRPIAYRATEHRFLSDGTTERMRIDSSGNLLVGTTGAIGRVGATFPNTQYGFTASCTSTTGTAIFNRFLYNTSTEVGTISSTGTTTSYVTTSDYRLKENIAPMTGALAKVAALKPCTYTWKTNGSEGQGFIAHELQAVVPDAVTGQKDAVDEEGNPVYQGIDTSFLVATLTAAIQELKAEVDSLKSELIALKG